MERSVENLEACSDKIVNTRSAADLDARFILGFFVSIAAS